jgi:hypothetical protein
MYEFYMEQSFVYFGYIFPLKSKHFPQGSGYNLCSCYSKHNYTRPSGDPSSSQEILVCVCVCVWVGGGGGWRQQERYVISKLQRTASFILVESLDVSPEHTHKLTPCRLPSYFRKIRVDNCLFSFYKRVAKNSKSGRYRLTSGSKLIVYNAPCHRRKLFCWPADTHSCTRSPHPTFSSSTPAKTFA